MNRRNQLTGQAAGAKAMPRRDFLRKTGSLALGACLAAALPSSAFSAGEKKPNIVFILADDMGWGDLGCYGNPDIKTPNLDRLAGRGTLFTNYYTSAPSCSPTRASLMTGQYPGRTRIHAGLHPSQEIMDKLGMAHHLDPEVPTVTRLFQKAGYKVGHFGKWHLGEGPLEKDLPRAPSPDAYGIDEYKIFAGNGNSWKNFQNPHISETVVDESMRFIEENKDAPFYLQVWLKDPHAYLDPTKEQMEPYKALEPPTSANRHHGALKVYYSVITEMDRQIGRLLDQLDSSGLAENTIIVFTNDNGPESVRHPSGQAAHSGVGNPGPFRGQKHSIYEAGIRAPMIVSWPDHFPSGRVDDETIMSVIDWMPTAAGLCGLQAPGGLDGEDMTEAFMGRPVARKEPLYWVYRFGGTPLVIHQSPILAIREGQWKLLMNPDGSRVELYDLAADPSEVDNKADVQPALAEKMSQKVLAFDRELPQSGQNPMAGNNGYPWPKSKEKNQ